MLWDLNSIWVYRIVHIDNMAPILRDGMFTLHHVNANSAYINIGDSMLIRQRDDYPVGLPGYGLLGDYIPFYFGILSPMLLKIKTGDGGVKKFPQSKIVYICCKLHKIIETCYRWCFTDGHAKDRFSVFYNSVNKLDKLDWDIIQARYWKNTEEDMDRMRRKQAEFLVKEHVPASCIGKIIVYDEEAQNKIQSIFEKSGSNLPVIIDRDNSYYYL